MFFKKEDQFFILLNKISENLIEGMDYFAAYRLQTTDDLQIFFDEVKAYETQGDTYVHEIIHELNKVFITPIEREDILALAMHMDDVLDGLEQIAAMFDMYQVTSADNYMQQFVEAIKASVLEIDKAVKLLEKKKLLDIREHAIKIKDYESKCDAIRRASIKHLFEREQDPIQIIKYKEIYEQFEDIADCCESVANTFEAIIMKNA